LAPRTNFPEQVWPLLSATRVVGQAASARQSSRSAPPAAGAVRLRSSTTRIGRPMQLVPPTLPPYVAAAAVPGLWTTKMRKLVPAAVVQVALRLEARARVPVSRCPAA
jgi:hypothetical protein